MPQSPRFAFSHVGVTVPDVALAIDWYTTTLGMYLLVGPLEVLEDDGPLGKAATGIYGVGFTRFQFAHLAGIDGIGVELFEFDSPKSVRRNDNFEFWMGGIYHFSLTAPDVSGMVDLIVAAGGRQRSEILIINEEKGYSLVYCEDPWGTVIELCSHPYSQLWAG